MNQKRFFTFAAITTAAATGAAVSAYLSTRILIETALNRESPKIMKKSRKKISGKKRDDAFASACLSASERLKNLPHKVLYTTAPDGVRLAGHFFPCDNPKRLIIAFHGWRSSWHRDYGLIAPFWHSSGCSVLYVEQRGQNNSGGEYMGFGLTERYDCAHWAKLASKHLAPTIPIYLAGLSMGAATVLMASDLSLPENTCGIIADCGFTSPKAIWKHVIKNNLHMSYTLRGKLADLMCRRKIFMSSDEYSTVSALKRTSLPILFIHGDNDSFVPVEMTYENYAACASPKRLLIVHGAEHAMSYYKNRTDYEKAVCDFWETFDSL